MNSNHSAANDRAVAFIVPVNEAYTAIRKAKHMITKVGRSRPKAMLRLLVDFEAHFDTVYAEDRLWQTALEDMTKIAYELRQAYDQLSSSSDAAYQEGYQDALKEVLDKRTHDEVVAAWLFHMPGTTEARQYLEAGDEG